MTDAERRIYEATDIPLAIYSYKEGKVITDLVSNGLCQMVGFTRERLQSSLTNSMFERVHPDDAGKLANIGQQFARRECGYNVLYRSRLKGSKEYSFLHTIGRWQKMEDGSEAAILVYTDISESLSEIDNLNISYNRLQKDRFYTDPLTELPNVNYLREFGREKVAEIRSNNRTPMLVYSDVEAMQSYNNQYGLKEGDNLLRLISGTLKEFFPRALVTRSADDHFIMLTGVDDRKELTFRLNQVNEKVKRTAKGNTGGIRSGVCPVEETDTGDMVGLAIDHAKHALKRLDTNLNQMVRFFSPESDEHYWRSRYIVENIDRAVANGWIKVYYHGLYRVENQKVTAFEALARWVDPIRGIISPAEFIPALQKYHLLYKLDLCMFEQVCREIKTRHENDLPLIPVSVNFSRQDFDHVDVVDQMNEIFEKSGAAQYIDKSYFIVEITEQEVAADPQSCQMQMRRIKESGYRIWLDDFGSGYSSFNMFSIFQFDLIKFDMELIRHLDDNNGANRLILRDLVHLAKALKLHTLIEGVETEEQMNFVREIGCELVQGFYYQKPEPLDEILFRIHSGDQIRACETPEERAEMNKNWFCE